MTIFELIGYVGVVLYITSYALLATQRISGDSISYHFLNLIAPSCVLVSLSDMFNAPSMVIQLIWIIISLTALFRIFKQKRGVYE